MSKKDVLYGDRVSVARGIDVERTAFRRQLREDKDRGWCYYPSYMAGHVDGVDGEYNRMEEIRSLCLELTRRYAPHLLTDFERFLQPPQ